MQPKNWMPFFRKKKMFDVFLHKKKHQRKKYTNADLTDANV